jgi:hypothetical protein
MTVVSVYSECNKMEKETASLCYWLFSNFYGMFEENQGIYA